MIIIFILLDSGGMGFVEKQNGTALFWNLVHDDKAEAWKYVKIKLTTRQGFANFFPSKKGGQARGSGQPL